MTDERKRLRELWSRFKNMTPEERNEHLQAFFCECCMEDDDNFPMADRIKLFKELIKSFEVSAKFQMLKGDGNELFPDPVGGLQKVPQQIVGDAETGSNAGDT